MSLIKLLARLAGGLLLVFLLVELGFAAGLRRAAMRWGATDEEARMSLPGDSLIPPTSVVSTRAITIHAPVAQVWPWIAQLGQERGGFYSYTWLENIFGAGMHNADQLLPAERQLKLGDRVSYFQDGPPGAHATVSLLEPGRYLSMGGWTFYLQPIDAVTTRLIVRYPSYPIEGSWINVVTYYGMFEQIHFIMETGMMMGIKQRAEGRLP